MSKIHIFSLDDLNNIKEEINMKKPKSYQQLFERLENKYKNIQNNHEIFILDNNNKEIKISNEEEYITVNNILFIREKNNKRSNEPNHNIPSVLKTEVLKDKFNCILCTNISLRSLPERRYISCPSGSHRSQPYSKPRGFPSPVSRRSDCNK